MGICPCVNLNTRRNWASIVANVDGCGRIEETAPGRWCGLRASCGPCPEDFFGADKISPTISFCAQPRSASSRPAYPKWGKRGRFSKKLLRFRALDFDRQLIKAIDVIGLGVLVGRVANRHANAADRAQENANRCCRLVARFAGQVLRVEGF